MDAQVVQQRLKSQLLSYDDIDKRTNETRLRKVLVVGRRLERDLGKDPSTAQVELIRRAAVLAVLLEDTETRLLIGQPIDLNSYLNAANVQKRLLQALMPGLQRKAREVSSPLGDLLRNNMRKQQAQVE